MMKKKWLWTPAILIAVAVISYGLFIILQPPLLPQGFLYGNGHIEGIEISISAEGTGRVLESRLVEGRQVADGELLLRLDDEDLQTRLAQASAEQSAVNNELAALDSQLRTWRHHLSTADSDLKRHRELKKSGTITAQRLNQVEDVFQETRGKVQVLEDQYKQSKNRLEAAHQQMALMQLQLDKAQIRTPVAGTVLVKGIEVGELAVPGKVVAVLVDMSRLEMKIYIPERDIGKVKLGATARIRVDAFPQRYFGASVSRVDQRAQFTPRDIHMPDERVRMVFGVTLSVANEEGYLKPGMPADAWLKVQDDLPWPEQLVVPR
jgi:HlyD family secretion protein